MFKSDKLASHVKNKSFAPEKAIMEGTGTPANGIASRITGIAVLVAFIIISAAIGWTDEPKSKDEQSKGKFLEAVLLSTSQTKSPIRTVCLHERGMGLMSLERDGTVRAWNLSMNQLEGGRPIPANITGGSVTAVAASSYFHLFAIARKDGRISLLNDRFETSQLFSGNGVVAFSSNQAILATGSTDGKVRLWETQTGHAQRTLDAHKGTVLAIAISPNGKFIATAGSDRAIRIWNLEDGSVLRTFSLDKKTLSLHLAFSPDAACLASGGSDGAITLWKVSEGSRLHTFTGHSAAISSILFVSAESIMQALFGPVIVSASEDGTVRLWNVREKKVLLEVRCHKKPVRSIGCSLRGDKLITGGDDATLKLWQFALPVPKPATAKHLGGIRAASVKLLARQTFDLPATVEPNHVAISGDGSLIAVGSIHSDSILPMKFRSDVTVWFADKAGPAYTEEDIQWLDGLSLSPDGSQLAIGVGGQAPNIRVIDLSSSKVRWKSNASGYLVRFSPGGKRILSSGFQRDARNPLFILDADTGMVRRFLLGNHEETMAVAWSPLGDLIAIGGEGNTVRLWGAEERRLVSHHETDMFAECIESVAFSPDGRLVAASRGNGEGTISIWDVESGRELRLFTVWSESLKCVDFLGDNRTLVTCVNRNIELWDAETGRRLLSVPAHEGYIEAIALSADRTRLVSVGRDHKARLWSLEGATGVDLKKDSVVR
jgi:WD40 repeat protein